MEESLPDRRYLFIITYGRSGSTLLMNLLNSSPGCRIRGENNNVLYLLYQSYRALVQAQEQHGVNSGRYTSAWSGIADIDTSHYRGEIVKLFIDHILRPEPTDTVLGFKEIRYSYDDIPDIGSFVRFLFSSFPYLKIVVNHRNVLDVAKSKWWAHEGDSISRLQDIDLRLLKLADKRRIFHFNYDMALEDRRHIRELFQWSGLHYNSDAIDDVLSIRHSY